MAQTPQNDDLADDVPHIFAPLGGVAKAVSGDFPPRIVER